MKRLTHRNRYAALVRDYRPGMSGRTWELAARGQLAMPPNEACPHCGELILDWHNEWYEGAHRKAVYSGQAAMDCPLCRMPVLWFESRDIVAPPVNAQVPVIRRSVLL